MSLFEYKKEKARQILGGLYNFQEVKSYLDLRRGFGFGASSSSS